MNRKLYLDVCAVLAAWCLFLNGFEKTGILLLLLSAALLLCGRAVRDLWRFLAISLLTGVLSSLLLSTGSIPVFFPHAALFLDTLAVHVGLLYEMSSGVSGDLIRPFFLGTVMLMLLFYGIALCLPSEWYTLFTKGNLYDLISFIFLPLVIPMAVREIGTDIIPVLDSLFDTLSE